MTREEAIDHLSVVAERMNDKGRMIYVGDVALEAVDMAIEALQGCKADEWCTDCKEYDTARHCCPRFNRVIRETLNEAAERKTGKWIVSQVDGQFHCSACNHLLWNTAVLALGGLPNACPWCTVKMEVDE